MKKTLSCILFATAVTLSSVIIVNAQDIKTPDKFIIGITGGISSPSGNFTKTDYDNNASGFAGSGYNVGISGTWFIKEHWGISALFSYHHYSYQGIQNIANGFHGSFDVDSASATTRGSNNSVNVLVGPYYSIPVTRKISVDLRLLGGIVRSSLAGWDVVLTDAGITHPALTQDLSIATAFGMQGGIGLRYKLTRQCAIMLNCDYFYSRPNFKITNADRNANTGREITEYNQPIAGLNTNFTLVYDLF